MDEARDRRFLSGSPEEEALEWVPSAAEIERTRDAVNLVLHDVTSVLGADAVTVVVGTPDELRANRLASRSQGRVYGWVLSVDGSEIGIWRPEELAWPEVVVSIADVIQEAIIEGAEHWGVAFPSCPTHGNHPMNAQVVDGVASWICPKEGAVPIHIGTLKQAEIQ
jgi:hypothetical protein